MMVLFTIVVFAVIMIDLVFALKNCVHITDSNRKTSLASKILIQVSVLVSLMLVIAVVIGVIAKTI